MKHSSHVYGADVTFTQAVGLCIALCLGTMVEWYDFTIYSQLSSTLTAVFFPKDNPATAELAFWGVYAVGFISRPLGAVLFGHIGDSLGRRVTLLISILAITLPTTIIGALPTYAQAGIVAPVLLAVLRFIQGVAVGGEFGSAIVYLYEMAPRHRRGVVASLGQLAISPGIILGIAACLAVLYGCNPDQLEVWGWRLPFLVTVVAAPLAVILRMHMPEPYEFLHSKQEMVLHRVASTAAAKVARGFAKQYSQAGSSARKLSSRQVSMHLMSMTRVSLDATSSAAVADASHYGAEAGVQTQKVSIDDPEVQALPADSSSAAQPPDSSNNHGSSNGRPIAGQQNNGGHHSLQEMRAHELSIQSEVKLQYNQRHELDDLGCEGEFEEECQELSKKIKHHMPLVVLLKGHWKGLWLQFFLEAVYGALFYVFFSWAPPYLHTATGVSTQLTLLAVMLGMALFAATVPMTGYLVDKGIPKVWFYMGLICIDAAVCIPVLYGLYRGSVAALLVLLPVMLGLSGCHGGLMTSIGPQIYPAGVRATGYNLGHNLAMSIWGGLTPFMVSALALVLQPPALAAGVLIVIVAVVSWVAAIPLTKVAPETNAGDGCSCCKSHNAIKDDERTDALTV